MKRQWIGRVAIKVVCALALVALLGWVVERLWNWLVPSIIGWKAIGYGQALGLLVLSKLLFGGIHRRGGGRMRWKRQMRARWEQMTPAEQQRFRAGLRSRCSWSRGGERGTAEPMAAWSAADASTPSTPTATTATTEGASSR